MYVLSRHAFISLLGPLERLIDINHIARILMQIDNLRAKGAAYASGLAAKSLRIEFSPGDLIAVRGEACDRFNFIQNGECYVADDGSEHGSGEHEHHGKEAKMLTSGDCIGSDMFAHEHTGQFQDTIVAETVCTCLEISWEDYHHFDAEFGHQVTDDELLDIAALTQNVDGSMNALLSNLAGGSSRARKIALTDHLSAVESRRRRGKASKKQKDIISEAKTALGRPETIFYGTTAFSQMAKVQGSFGCDVIVKIFSKARVMTNSKASTVIRERDFHSRVGNHPFMQNLMAAYTTVDEAFLVLGTPKPMGRNLTDYLQENRNRSIRNSKHRRLCSMLHASFRQWSISIRVDMCTVQYAWTISSSMMMDMLS